MSTKKKILVSPLNWGLGHASRCIPIIRMLLKKNAEVIVASEGASLKLLQEEFPQLFFIELEPIDVRYSKYLPMTVSMGLQTPKLIRSIAREHQVLEQLIKQHNIQGVISDNRYGMYSKKVPSVIISHQLFIQTPFLQRTLQKLIRNFLHKFSECWVPDFPGSNNLSGKLSHGNIEMKNTVFIGPLSRFEKTEIPKFVRMRPLIIVLSGPEPNRTLFEKKLLKQLAEFKIECLLVRGLPNEASTKLNAPNWVNVVSHLPSEMLQNEILHSEIMLCRSGYSSIMDLYALRKKAILIPTKGQTEQIYLGKYLMQKNYFYSTSENLLTLKEDLKKAMEYNGITDLNQKSNLDETITSFLANC